ncbi:MAG: diaminobutyrate--2-oxoglutarate transaminase [Gammaproteobacteria bacterium]|nr:diaminobutyrate--2-oxoglutarate transaminase [Gammaproteobacteria bacterium]
MVIESKIASYNKSFPATFVSAKESHLVDVDGNRFLDFFTGAGTVNYGHNNSLIKRALITYLEEDGIMHSMDMDTWAKLDLLTALDEIILKPRQLDYKVQLCAPSGANAVEAGLKLARKVKQRNHIIAFTRSFHGMTQGALEVTANKYYKSTFTASSGQVSFFPYENYLDGCDALQLLRQMLCDEVSGIELPAAIILETVQADGGVHVASTRFLQGLRLLCDELDILMIVDDIQVGNGRTGDFFSFERAGIVPDIVTLSKAVGGGMPLALLLFREALDQWKTGEHSGTFRGNNLSFVAASAALRGYWQEELFSNQIKEKGQLIASALSAIEETVRGCGMIFGVELTPERALAVREYCFRHQLILELVGARDHVVKLLPPLTISHEDLDHGLRIFVDALEQSR